MLDHPLARLGLDRKSKARSFRLWCISIFVLVAWFWLAIHWQLQLGGASNAGGGCNAAEVAKAKAFAAAATTVTTTCLFLFHLISRAPQGEVCEPLLYRKSAVVKTGQLCC